MLISATSARPEAAALLHSPAPAAAEHAVVCQFTTAAAAAAAAVDVSAGTEAGTSI
jgi:hypothetical protein